MDVIDEVRSILDGTASRSVSPIKEDRDSPPGPSALDEAYELVRDHRELVAALHRKADRVARSMGQAWRSVQLSSRSQRQALESLRGKVLPALTEFRDYVESAIRHVEEVTGADEGNVPRRVSDRLDQLDAALLAMSEGRSPAADSPPENARANDYYDDLLAATREAEDAIGAVRQLQVGSTVSVGRKKLKVGGLPTSKDNRWMVDLVSSPAGDAYTLVVSENEIQLRRGGLVMEMTPADLYISEQYGSHMYGYGDYGRHSKPGKATKFGTVWISPGDSIDLGGEVFRVVDINDSGALIQPKANIKNPSGHVSLAGTQVAKYDPHRGQYTFVSNAMPGGYEMASTIQVVGHNPGDPRAVGEGVDITLAEFEAMEEAKGSGTFGQLKSIVSAHQAAKVGGVFVDVTTASMLLKVHEALSPANREKFESLPVRKMVAIGWKLVN